MKTIKQISEELGVSKQAVHKRITREPLCTSLRPYISTVDGTIYIDVDGENLIKSAYTHQPSTDNVSNNKPSEPSMTNNQVHDYVYDILKETIDLLRIQLAVKDEQISSLTEINKNLSESISVDRRNELAETIIDGNKLIEQEKDKPPQKLKKKNFFAHWFSED